MLMFQGHSTVFFCHGGTDMAHCFVVKRKTVAYISFIFGMMFSDYTKHNIQQQKLNLGEKKCVKNAKKGAVTEGHKKDMEKK